MYYTICDPRTGYDARVPESGINNVGEITYSVYANEAGKPRLSIQITYGKGLKSSGHGTIGSCPDRTRFGPADPFNLPQIINKRADKPEISDIFVDRQTGKLDFEWSIREPEGSNGYVRSEYKIRDNIWKSYYQYQPINEKVRKHKTIELRFCAVHTAPSDYTKSEWVYHSYTDKVEKDMSRERDWEVITGWEKRIKVDFGSIGPNHVRWSDWTYKERDIVARKVHESASVSRDHGPRSRKMEEWAKENAPIMIDFARDHKPMPDWAHADYRKSGIPEHVQVVWKREVADDPASKGDWAYEPEYPWEEGEEPAWSAKPMEENMSERKQEKVIGLETEGKMDSKFNNVISYKEMPNGDHVATDGTVISTRESRAKEDVPQWRKFELGRLEIVDNVVIPGPNALPKDEEQYGENVKLTKRHKVEQKKLKRTSSTQPDTGHFISVGELELKEGKIVCPVKIKSYPIDMDELLGRAYIADDSTVSMQALEASAAGQRYVETVTLASSLTFQLPQAYGLEKQKRVKVQFYFRDSTRQMARTKDWWCTKEMPKGVAPVKIMPDDPTYTPAEKAMNWASEAHHGKNHQHRWNMVAAAFGVDNGYSPMSAESIEKWWRHHGQNKRWSMAMNAIGNKSMVVKREKEMAEYHNSPPIQGNYTVKEWIDRYGMDPEIALIDGWGFKYIIDPQAQVPLWKTDDDAAATSSWRYEDGEWFNIEPKLAPAPIPLDECVDNEMEIALRNGDWAEVARLASMKANTS